MAFQRKIIGTCKTCGPGAYYCNLFTCLGNIWNFKQINIELVDSKTFKVTNGKRVIELTSVTYRFTGSIANPATYGRKRVCCPYEHISLFEPSLADVFEVPGNICIYRTCIDTCGIAGAIFAFVNTCLVGNRLRKRDVNRLSWTYTHVELAFHDNRTNWRAVSACCAFLCVNVSRLF